MRGIIALAFLLLTLLPSSSYAANCSFANPTACGSPGMNNVAIGGTATIGGALTVNGNATFTNGFSFSGALNATGGGTLSGAYVNTFTGSGTAISPSTDTHWSWTYTGTDPTGEARPATFTSNANYTGGSNNNVTLGIDSELLTIVGTAGFGSSTYNPQGTGGGEHQSALYGHSKLQTAPPMFGCTINVDCPGTTFATNGVNGFADNVSTGELFSARSFQAHSPTTSKSFTVNGYQAGFGGTVDMWSVMSSDDARSGIDVAQAVGIVVGANTPYENNGFGAANPIAAVHARCGNRTDSATGWVSGNTLYLATAPTVALQIGPGNVVTGTGGFVSAHLMSATTSAPVAGVTPGGFFAYTIDGSPQTVGSQGSPITFTFTETCIPLVVNNFSTGGLATIGFIAPGNGSTNSITASIDQGVDSTAPLGNYLDFKVNGAISAYVYSAGGSRPAGMAIGFTSPPGSLPLDALWVSGSAQADVLRLNASGSTSLTTTGNVGIGVGRVGVGTRLLIQGPDTGATNALAIQDSGASTIFRIQDNGLVVVTGGLNTNTITATAVAPTVGGGQVGYGGTTAAASNCGSLASSTGCLVINVAGTTRYVPFY